MRVSKDPVLRQMLDEERVESSLLDTTLLGRLFVYLRPHRRLAAGAISLAILDSLMMTLPAYLIGLTIDRVSGANRQSQGLVSLLDGWAKAFAQWALPDSEKAVGLILFFGLLVSLLWLLRWFVGAFTTYLVQKLGQLIVHDLRCDLFRHITGMDSAYFHRNPVGRLVNRTTFDVQSLAELFSDAFAQGLRDVFFILILIAVMLGLDIPLALILIGTFPLLFAVGLLYRARARPALRTNSAVLSRMNAWMAENLAGMRENHLYRAQDRRRAEYKQLTEAHQTTITRVIRAWALVRPGMMMTSALATALILFLGYGRVTSGMVTVGVLLTFLQYTIRIWIPVRNLVEKFNLIQTALTGGERILDVLDTHPTITDLPEADPQLRVQQGAIRFEGVTFRYPTKEEDALHEVSFEVRPGQMLALVGNTGAGKTTIARLLSRFYDVSAGSILLDEHNVRRYPLKQLRSAIALVPQEVVVFAGSVRENITLGQDIPDEHIWKCVRAVRADLFLDHLPGQLDHELEEGGRTLSTGQRQLLSFARALAINPPVMILDEATANVDTQTEQLIQRALEVLTAGRTSVVIAHRLSTIQHADRILVLRHGRIIEEGNHQQLLEQNGEYARLYQLHLSAPDQHR